MYLNYRSYEKKYKKYKRKYQILKNKIELKKNILNGGECDPLPNIEEYDLITSKNLLDLCSEERITIQYKINVMILEGYING